MFPRRLYPQSHGWSLVPRPEALPSHGWWRGIGLGCIARVCWLDHEHEAGWLADGHHGARRRFASKTVGIVIPVILAIVVVVLFSSQDLHPGYHCRPGEHHTPPSNRLCQH
jgi:hypothetical protein